MTLRRSHPDLRCAAIRPLGETAAEVRESLVMVLLAAAAGLLAGPGLRQARLTDVSVTPGDQTLVADR